MDLLHAINWALYILSETMTEEENNNENYENSPIWQKSQEAYNTLSKMMEIL